MRKHMLYLLLSLSLTLCGYEFTGVHYFASYTGCDSTRIANWVKTYAYFIEGVDKSGATILKHTFHRFDNSAMTAVLALSESHASIHTYPEHTSVFVDLFTCGTNCHWRPFENTLVHWLKPKKIQRRVALRS